MKEGKREKNNNQSEKGTLDLFSNSIQASSKSLWSDPSLEQGLKKAPNLSSPLSGLVSGCSESGLTNEHKDFPKFPSLMSALLRGELTDIWVLALSPWRSNPAEDATMNSKRELEDPLFSRL